MQALRYPRGGLNAARDARPDLADRHHRLVSPPALVRRESVWPIVQGGPGRLDVPRAVFRRRGRRHQCPGSRGPRYRDRRRQPLRPGGGRQVLVLLSHRAARRHRGASGHLPGLDAAPRPAPGQDPLGGAGGLSAGGGEEPAHARPPRVRRALEGRPAPHRQAREVRRDLRARPRRDALGRALRRRPGAHQRPQRHHERGVPGACRRRLPAHPGRGAAPSRPQHAPRLHRRRSRVPHRGVQPPARRRRRGDLGAYLLGESESAAGLLEDPELRARAAVSAAARRRRHHVRVREHRRHGPARSSPGTRPTRRSASG